jgi:hypothetical protein
MKKYIDYAKMKQYSLVYFNFDGFPKEFDITQYPFKRNHPYVYFGEIPNMPGHCVVMDHKTGQMFSGYHIEDFIEIPEDET